MWVSWPYIEVTRFHKTSRKHDARLCIKLGREEGDGDIGTRVWGLVTLGRETRDLGTSSMGRGDVWDGDVGRQIQ